MEDVSRILLDELPIALDDTQILLGGIFVALVSVDKDPGRN